MQGLEFVEGFGHFFLRKENAGFQVLLPFALGFGERLRDAGEDADAGVDLLLFQLVFCQAQGDGGGTAPGQGLQNGGGFGEPPEGVETFGFA